MKNIENWASSNLYTEWLCVCSAQECPSGVVDEDTFKGIYAQFFPQGSKSCSPCCYHKLMKQNIVNMIVNYNTDINSKHKQI